MKRLLLTLLNLIVLLLVSARHYDFTAQRISVADGLPSNVVSRIWQTNEGYMCFETRSGLCLYDGYQVQRVEGEVGRGAVRQERLLTRDAEWLRLGHGRLVRQGRDGSRQSWQLIPEDIIAYTRNDHFHVADVDERTEAVSTYGAGLYLYDKPTGELTSLRADDGSGLLDDNYLTGLYVDRTGCIWLIEDYLGVKCLRMNQLHYRPLWLKPQARIQDDNYIRCIAPLDSTRLLVSNQTGGLYEYDVLRDTFTFREQSGSRVYAALFDSKHRLWIGTRGNGLFCDGKPIGGLPSRDIFNIRETAGGTILVSMLRGGVAAIHANGETERVLSGKNAHDALADRDGRLWVATEDGLFAIEPVEGRWVGSHRCAAADSLAGYYVCLYTDGGSTVWAGSADRGLAAATCVRGKCIEARYYTAKNGLRSNAVCSITPDAMGHLWLGTEEGVALLNPQTHVVENRRTSQGMLGNVFCERAAVCLSDGRLLMGTHNGLVEIRPAEGAKGLLLAKTAITGITVNGQPAIPGTPLDYRQNNVSVQFSNFQYAHQQEVLYSYWLEGSDETWSSPEVGSAAVYRNLPPGHYVFHVRSVVGGAQGPETTLPLHIRQPWWNTWWAWCLYLALLAVACLLALRLLRLRRRLAVERRVSAFKSEFYSRLERELRSPVNVLQGAAENVKSAGTSLTTVQSLRRGARRVLKLMDMVRQFHQLGDAEMELKAEQADMDAEAERHFRAIQQSIRAEEEELKELAPPPINEQVVLLVGADEDSLVHLADTLNPYFKTITARSSEEALSMVGRQPPHLVLADITDNEADMRRLTQCLHRERPLMPVVHLSPFDADANQLRSLRAGAADYIVKPCGSKVLVERIGSLVGRAAVARPADAAEPSAMLLTDVKDKKFLDHFQTVLDAHVAKADFSVEQWARLMGLGRTQFYKKVKALTGETPVQHLHRARLDYAARLLRESQATVDDVMTRAGFSSATHFYNSFKKQFGVSPRNYRLS